MPLPGGFQRDDKVVFIGTRFEDAHGRVDVGDVGRVVGSHGDSEKRIMCGRFTNRNENIHVDAASDIVTEAVYNAPLIGGFNRGDRVVFIGTRYDIPAVKVNVMNTYTAINHPQVVAVASGVLQQQQCLHTTTNMFGC